MRAMRRRSTGLRLRRARLGRVGGAGGCVDGRDPARRLARPRGDGAGARGSSGEGGGRPRGLLPRPRVRGGVRAGVHARRRSRGQVSPRVRVARPRRGGDRRGGGGVVPGAAGAPREKELPHPARARAREGGGRSCRVRDGEPPAGSADRRRRRVDRRRHEDRRPAAPGIADVRARRPRPRDPGARRHAAAEGRTRPTRSGSRGWARSGRESGSCLPSSRRRSSPARLVPARSCRRRAAPGPATSSSTRTSGSAASETGAEPSCVDVAGATAASYTVSPLDLTSTLRVVVTAGNRFGTVASGSQPTAVVVRATRLARPDAGSHDRGRSHAHRGSGHVVRRSDRVRVPVAALQPRDERVHGRRRRDGADVRAERRPTRGRSSACS